jgi:hypothetical protein
MSDRPAETWHYDRDRGAWMRGKETIALCGPKVRIDGILAYQCNELLVVAPYDVDPKDGAFTFFAGQIYQLLPTGRIISDPSEAESYAALLGQALGKVKVGEPVLRPSIDEIMRRAGWTKQ